MKIPNVGLESDSLLEGILSCKPFFGLTVALSSITHRNFGTLPSNHKPSATRP